MHITAQRDSTLRGKRRGLTLVEILLVLALLVVISGIVLPLLEGTFSRAALYGAGDLLQGAWAQARFASMQSGQIHAFRFEPNANHFQIVSLDSLGAPESNGLAPEDPDNEPQAADFVRLSDNRLPEGVVFNDANISSSAQTLATMPMTADSAWSTPILFYPDGTTSDATVLLANSDGVAIRVTLRGLTGISQTADAEIIDTEIEATP
jgi:prepilin-type N-terminal cleavage/methylation domain-containing protein